MSEPTSVLPPMAGGDDIPMYDAHSSMSFMQVAAIARSYWRVILLIWVLTTAALATVLLLMPKTYSATVTLVVDNSSDSTLTGQNQSADRLGTYLAEQTELITSPVLLLPVVTRLGLTQDRTLAAGFIGDPRGLPDYVAKRLSTSLQVLVSPNAQLMYVTATAGSSTEAAEIANAVVDQYFAEGRGRAERYAEQLTELRAKVATAQANLAAFRAQKGVLDVSDPTAKGDTETQALDTLEGKLLDAQNQVRSLEAQETGDPTSAEEALASPQVQQLQGQLHTLQTEQAQLRTIYGPEHPKILALESQIATTRQALNNEATKIRSDLATELQRARALEAQYTAALAAQRQRVVELRDVQGQGGRLVLELESAQSVYKDALAGYEQAMFTSVDKFTNLRVISRAAPPVSSSKTKKREWLALGSLAGLALGFALPFAYELLINRRLRCRDDLERALGVRVLAQIGPIPPPGHV